MNTFEKIIKDHLEKMAKGDAVFAQKFYDRCEKEKDAIKDCCSYITSKAKKQALSGCAAKLAHALVEKMKEERK